MQVQLKEDYWMSSIQLFISSTHENTAAIDVSVFIIGLYAALLV